MNNSWIVKYQNIISGCIVALILTTIAAVFFRDRINYMLIKETQIGMVDVTRQDVQIIRNRIDSIYERMEIIAHLIAQQDVDNLAAISNDMEIAMKSMEFSAYGILTINGKGLIGPDMPLGEYRPIVRAVRGKRGHDYLFSLPQQQGRGVIYAVPIMKDKIVKGVLYGTYKGADIQEMPLSTFGEGGFFCVFDAKGHCLVSSETEQIVNVLEQRFICWQDQSDDKELFSLFNKVSQYGEGVEKITLQDKSEYLVACIPLDNTINTYLFNVVPLSLVHNRIQKVLDVVTMVMLVLLILLLVTYSYSQYRTLDNQEELFRLAYVDELTGVGNLARYKKEFSQKRRLNLEYTMCVISMDVNDMKEINEIMGFHFGNEMLMDISRFVTMDLRDNEAVYRIDSDIFYMIMFCKARTEISARLNGLIETITSYFRDKHGIALTMACGVCFMDRGVISVEDSVQAVDGSKGIIAKDQSVLVSYDALDMGDNATLARRQGKSPSKNSVCFFDEEVKRRHKLEKELEDAFIPAMKNGEFTMYYQPKYDIRGEVPVLHGAEALVRWISPINGFMSPAIFIPLFERDGNCEKLDMHVAELVCRQISQWLKDGYEVMPVSINISRQTIMQGHKFVDSMEALLDKYGVSKKYVELEVLESGTADDEGILINFLEIIRKRGFKIAMDDFGTGYSSLGLLSRTGIDCLKLDKSFFDGWDARTMESRKNLVEHIFKLCHSVGAEIVAEGIESEQQVEVLKTIGCDVIQGYVFSKPLPAENYQEKLQKNS